MNDELFQALLTSVQQADAIISGKAEPTRINSFAEDRDEDDPWQFTNFLVV